MSDSAQKKPLDFMRLRWLFVGFSLLLIGFSIYQWFSSGDSKYGVDFLGGVEVVVKFNESIAISEVRNVVTEAGFGNAIVQKFEGGGSEYSIRLKAAEGSSTPQKITDALKKLEGHTFDLRKEDFVGPTIGAEIRQQGVTALVLALIGILIYISIRFEFRFAIGAISALVHDVIITTGIYVVSGREISSGVLAALLTIVGYSLNDTIVVFDRVRENMFQQLKKGGVAKKKTALDFVSLVNLSIGQTLSRTMLTSLTTLFVVTALWLLGGGAVVDLAFTLVIGIIVGTYSSIFIACPVIVALEKEDDGSTTDK